MIYYISDLHLGHKNIIKFDNRPFKDVDEMEKCIVENWNNVVCKNDVVYILGDMIWKAQDKEWIRILDLLNGQKILIRGNHDIKTMSHALKNKFRDIKDYLEISDSGKHVVMSHYPILCYKGAYNPNCVMLFGHVHTTRENDFVNKWRQELRDTCSNSGDSMGMLYNVGCMLPYMDYTPRTLDQIIEGAEKDIEKIHKYTNIMYGCPINIK